MSCPGQHKKSLPKAKTQGWVQTKGRNKFRCNASAGETLKVTKLPRWPVVQFQGDLATRYILGHSWQVTRYKGAAIGKSPGTRVPPTISCCTGHSGCQQTRGHSRMVIKLGELITVRMKMLLISLETLLLLQMTRVSISSPC